MKAQVIILTLLLALLSVNGFAKTNDGQDNSQQKTVKVKYDYNLFKLCLFDLKQPLSDSLLFYKEQKKAESKRKND